MPKLDKITYQKRLFAIQGWIIEGVQPALIVRQIINQGWTKAKTFGNQKRSAERMLADARVQWTEMPEAEIKQKRILRISKLEQYQRNLKEEYKCMPSGIRALVAAEKLIIDLEGTKAPLKLEHSGVEGKPIQIQQVPLTKEEIDALSKNFNDNY